MTPEIVLALASFAFVMAFTPGPNNIMLTASGANFGFVRSIPHMAGVVIGFVALLMACGGGLGTLVTSFPQVQIVLKVAGSAYMLWLAWKIASASSGGEGERSTGRLLTFWQAAAFQWVNPKGIVIALGAVALYVRPDRALADLAVLLGVFGTATLLSAGTWLCFGAALSRVLREPRRARTFNIVMAVLLVASIVPMVL
jgi:threonine/homoserine/homoserine lactone efflux protein